MKIDLEGKTEIGKSTRATLEDCKASRVEHLCIDRGHPETDRSYCVNQHANMRMLVHGHPTPDPANIQLGKWGVYMRPYGRPYPPTVLSVAAYNLMRMCNLGLVLCC